MLDKFITIKNYLNVLINLFFDYNSVNLYGDFKHYLDGIYNRKKQNHRIALCYDIY